jgi:hypothetical protein
MIVASPFGGKHGIEALSVEIEQIDRMPDFSQSGQRFLANRGVEAIVKRMTINV